MCDFLARSMLKQGETIGITRNYAEARACFGFYTVFARSTGKKNIGAGVQINASQHQCLGETVMV